MPKIIHNLIHKTAQAIAREAYEAIAHDNTFYAEWPNREGFVQANWKMFVDQARTALLKMLEQAPGSDPTNPTYAYPQVVRNEVFDALLKDGAQRSNPNDAPVRSRTRILN